jgi:hypothetical protein
MALPVRRAALVLAIGSSLLCAAGCSRLKRRSGPAPQPRPVEAFQAGEWKSPKGEVFRPPQVASETWRVKVMQEIPRQKKNPRWRTLKIDEAVDLEMPPGTRYRCLVNPVRFRPWEDEISSKVIKWDLIRSVRCSSDGWRTYSELVHGVSMGGGGETPSPISRQGELYLHDWVDGKRSQITVLVQWMGPVPKAPRIAGD